MSFDSSRFTSNPWNNFFGVVMPQGRVLLDSDWNEWNSEYARRTQAATFDIVGQSGVPSSTPDGFEIQLTTVGGQQSISIGPGRMYVDGMLAENHGTPTPNPSAWIPATGVGPLTPYPSWDVHLAEQVGISAIDYNSQPYYPDPTPFPQTGGPYLVYLDVWQRDITFLDDSDLIEKAVGVDTTGRLQTVWQVKFMPAAGAVNCNSDITGLDALLLPPGPALTTGVMQSTASGPCSLTSNTGYTGLENQLYRVEVHQPGTFAPGTTLPVTPAAGMATFKWSRDNASIATGVTAISPSGTELTVDSTGKDSVLRFSINDWIEVTDDVHILNGQAGQLAQITGISDTAKTITLSTAVTGFPLVNAQGETLHTRAVKWNQGGQIKESVSGNVWADLTLPGSTGDIPVPPNGTALELEDGVTVNFNFDVSGSPFTTGNYWNFAARTADGTVEYLDNAPPRGIYHHYARLALVTLPGTVAPCRNVFNPLTGIETGCCCCSVTVGDNINSVGQFSDIAAAIAFLTSTTSMVDVCLLPGSYSPPSTINITRTNITISGCPQASITYTGSGPLFSVGPMPPTRQPIIFKSLNILYQSTTGSPSCAIEITQSGDIFVEDCNISTTGSTSIAAQVTGLKVVNSQFSGGGIWIVDGSSIIVIQNNVIANVQGPGIAIGGLPTGFSPAPATAGVVGTEISDNLISGATNSGISTAVDPAGSGNPALGDTEALMISGNTISGCALNGPVQPYSMDAVAGILLMFTSDVCIRDNQIINNGNGINGIPASGVFLEVVINAEISNNQILNNGVPSTSPFLPGTQCGIGGIVTRSAASDVLKIHNNEVVMPAGAALEIIGIGSMSIVGNSLQSFGAWRATNHQTRVVEVANLGLSLEIYWVILAIIASSTLQPIVKVELDLLFLALVGGRTLFEDNQVTFVPTPAINIVMPSVFLSYDDLAIQNNQFQSVLALPHLILIDVGAVSFSLRSIGNRFSEFPFTTFLSHLGMGNYNIVMSNQATHPLVVFGTHTMPNPTTSNQHMF